jgi:hypothetical protein
MEDLVDYVIQRESWDVVALPAIAEEDATYDIVTPYGQSHILRKQGEILHAKKGIARPDE